MLNDLLAAVEPHAYAHALTAWLQANAEAPPRSLALDGKSVGDGRCGMIVTLCRHEDGRPVAMIRPAEKKKTAKSLKPAPCSPIPGGTGQRAGHGRPASQQRGHRASYWEKGGDYLIGTKANTSKRLEAATRALEGSPFLT